MRLARIVFHFDAFIYGYKIGLKKFFKKIYGRTLIVLWYILPFRLLFLMHNKIYSVSLLWRTRTSVSLEVQKAILGRSYDFQAVLQRKRLYESALHYGVPSIEKEIHGIADDLKKYALNIERYLNKPIIFAPLHMESDVLSAVICAFASPKREVMVVSAYTDEMIGCDESTSISKFGVTVNQFHPGMQCSRDGRRLIHMIKGARNRLFNLVIFPDAIPEYTHKVTGRGMREYPVKIFGRAGNLHAGLPNLVKAIDAVALYFYIINVNGRLQLNIVGTSEAGDIKEKSAIYIEKALSENPSSWLLWRYTSFYYFCSKRDVDYNNY